MMSDQEMTVMLVLGLAAQVRCVLPFGVLSHLYRQLACSDIVQTELRINLTTEIIIIFIFLNFYLLIYCLLYFCRG